MADILLDNQSASATPSAGQVVVFPETVGKRLSFKDDTGRTYTLGNSGIRNYATAAVAGFAADTYVVGSAITIPASLTLQTGTQYRCKISLSKTAAGVAAPTAIVRVGTLGTTGDTAVITFTGAAQTAVADVGFIEILCTWRTIGASGVLQGTFALVHQQANAVGLAGTNVLEVTSSAFNTTTASLIMGVSLNYGASAAVTTTQVEAELLNI
jgi:hypothetical protein